MGCNRRDNVGGIFGGQSELLFFFLLLVVLFCFCGNDFD